MENITLPEQAAELLLDLDDFIISAHIGPDGDAIGSVSALLIALKKLGKNVCAILEPFSKKYFAISGADLIAKELPAGVTFKTFIALDCADKNRLGAAVKFFDEAEITINIDHHISNSYYADYNYVDTNASATAEIMYKIICWWTRVAGASRHRDVGFAMDENISSACYAGILCDTGGFRHPSATADTYLAAGELIKNGADFSSIYRQLFVHRKYTELKIMAVAFGKMKREFGGRLVWTSITNNDLSQIGATLGDLDSIVDFLISVEGSKVAAFYYQKSDKEFKLSLRSVSGINVNEIALKFGGGGHKNAAGCSFFTGLEEAVGAATKEIEVALGRSS